MRKIGLLVMVGAIGLSAMSCSNTVTKADFKKELDAQGLPVDTQCLVDKLEAKGFKFRKYGELSADDQTKITEATTECITGTLGSITVPTTVK